MKIEEIEIMEAKFKAKTQILIEISIFREFNSYYMTIKAKAIMIVQKNQVE